MFKKENITLTKQGPFYQLNLNKNSGPFLAKDIMFNNPKSNALLTNQHILKEHLTRVKTMTDLKKVHKI
jgi:hypothetical protein